MATPEKAWAALVALDPAPIFLEAYRSVRLLMNLDIDFGPPEELFLAPAKWRPPVPFVLDTSHQQGTVELDRARREQRSILEKARLNSRNGQRLDPPAEAPQFQPVELARSGRRRVAQRASLEELGRLPE